MNPKVSIIIPAYNAEKYIEKCIENIINQSYKNIEIIVIDDGSTDSTGEIVERLRLNDSRINIIAQENSGPSIARNKGIERATGKYIAFIDSDDSIDYLYIEKLLIKMLDGNFDCVCCGYIEESRYGSYNLNHFLINNDVIDKERFVECIFSGVGGVLWAKIFKRKIIIDNNIRMDSKIFMCEDLLFILDYCQYSNKFGVINDYLYHYNRLNENSISSNININYLNNYLNVIYGIEDLLRKLSIDNNVIDNIVVEKVQSLVNSISFSEANKYIYTKNKYEYIKNMIDVLSIKLVKENKDKFKKKGVINKIYNIAISKEKCIVLLYLNLFNIFVINIKNKILRR